MVAHMGRAANEKVAANKIKLMQKNKVAANQIKL